MYKALKEFGRLTKSRYILAYYDDQEFRQCIYKLERRMRNTAKLFMNGRSQAVRLPREFPFDDCDEVYIRKDPDTGDIIISKKPDSWDGFFELLEETEVPDDFLLERDTSLPIDRDPLL